MATSRKIQEIEKQYGKPIKTILLEGYQKYGSQEAIAKVLGVRQCTISYWVAKTGLKRKVTLLA